MKPLNKTLTYAASPAAVYAMVMDSTFREEVCAAQHMDSATVTIQERGSDANVRIDQTRAVDGIPGFVKKFVGDSVQIVQEESWTSPTDATIKLTVPGKPGDITGTVTISGNETETKEEIRLRIKVSVPLVGGRIEDFVVGMLDKALDAEQRVGRRRLG